MPGDDFALGEPVGRTDESAGARSSGAISLSSVLRFKWTVLLVAVLVAGPAMAAVWMLIVPEYKARGEVHVRPIIDRLVFRTDENGMIPLYTSFVNTQVSYMRSPTVLQRVLDREDVQKTTWYRHPPKPLLRSAGSRMERLRESLLVSPRRQTEVIDVTFTAASLSDAETIVNAVLDCYIAYTAEKSDKTRDKLDQELAEKRRSLEGEIGGREKVLTRLRETLGTGTPEELVTRKRVRLDEAQAQLKELWRRKALLEWQKKQLENEIKKTSGDDPASTTQLAERREYHEDAEWRQLDVALKAAQHRAKVARKQLKPEHPTMISLAGEVQFAEDMLRLREAQLDELWRKYPLLATAAAGGTPGPDYRAQLTSVIRLLGQVVQEEGLLKKEVDEQQAVFDQTFRDAQALDKENKAIAHKRSLFEAVRQRLDQKEMERNVPGSIGVPNRAWAASKPDKDRRVIFTVMTLVAGLGAGLGLAFLRAGRSQTLYGADDLPLRRTPFLGQVPVIRRTKDMAVEDNPAMTESMRMVRTALLSRLDGQRHSAILISSANTGAGKSSVSVALGKSFAQGGKNVLLVDGDFRQRALSRRFDLVEETGFIQSLSNRAVDPRSIFPTNIPGLSVMPAGRCNGGSELELTANGALAACMAQMRRDYDIVLMDGSPILPVADARILSGQVDGTIMIVRERNCRRNEIVDAFACLGSSGGKLLGTIFVGSGRRGAYGYGYSYGGAGE